MNRPRGRRQFLLGTGVLAAALGVASVAYGCVGFKGHAYWEGNGVPSGVTTDGTDGSLHYPPTSGATWDLETIGASNGGPAHHYCYGYDTDELPGAGLDDDSSTNPPNSNAASWYGGSIAPIVYMDVGNTAADVAVKFTDDTTNCTVNGHNRMTSLTGSDGYEIYRASDAGAGLQGSAGTGLGVPNGCHAQGQGALIGSNNQVKVDSNGDTVDGSGNPIAYEALNFKAGQNGAGIVRMICVWDDDGVTSDAQAINSITV